VTPMRAVFVGAGSQTLFTARLLIGRGHEVVVVESDAARIETARDELDAGFLHGDATRPSLLREADPERADVLLCLTGNDQVNLIASLVGRSLGFPRVITRVDDEDFEHICVELGLRDTVVPARTIGRHLADLCEGRDALELSGAVKGDARAFVFVAGEGDVGPCSALDLPADTRATHLYRAGKLVVLDPDTALEVGDEVVLVTRRERVEQLRERWPGEGPRGRTPRTTP